MAEIGQHFRIVNTTKKEYIDPANLDDEPKLWPVCTGDVPRLLPYLLCQPVGQQVTGRVPESEYAGRWAGDEIVTVGQDCDSGLYGEVEEGEAFTEISAAVRDEFNEWVGDDAFTV